MQSGLSVREVAGLAEVPLKTVEKAVEERIVTPMKRKGRKPLALPFCMVPYAAVVGRLDVSLSVEKKRRLFKALEDRSLEDIASEPVEIAPALTVDVGKLIGTDLGARVERYARVRDRIIEKNPDVLGGTAVIRNSRISVYALLGRIENGETVDSIVDDYPEMDKETVETAITYARTHPLVGRPGGRPWASTS
jgi:uncharacterized protein (DUF433 family)